MERRVSLRKCLINVITIVISLDGVLIGFFKCELSKNFKMRKKKEIKVKIEQELDCHTYQQTSMPEAIKEITSFKVLRKDDFETRILHPTKPPICNGKIFSQRLKFYHLRPSMKKLHEKERQ